VLYMAIYIISFHIIRFVHLAFKDISLPIYRFIFTYYEDGFISFSEVHEVGTKVMHYESDVWLIILGIFVCIISSIVIACFSYCIFKRKNL